MTEMFSMQNIEVRGGKRKYGKKKPIIIISILIFLYIIHLATLYMLYVYTKFEEASSNGIKLRNM